MKPKQCTQMVKDPKILKRTGEEEEKLFPRHAPGYAGHVKIHQRFQFPLQQPNIMS